MSKISKNIILIIMALFMTLFITGCTKKMCGVVNDRLHFFVKS